MSKDSLNIKNNYFNSFEITTPPDIVTPEQQQTTKWYEEMTDKKNLSDSEQFSYLLNTKQKELDNDKINTKAELAVSTMPDTRQDFVNEEYQNNLQIINSLLSNITSQSSTRKQVSNSEIQSFIDNNWDIIKPMMNILIKDCGATIAEAAGIGGNIYGESGFDENAEGDGGKSTGLFQMDNWNWTQFRKMCNKNNWDPSSNVSLFKYVYNTASKKKDQYNNASKDPIEAMYWLCNTFEKPNPKKANYQAREQAALAIYNHLLDDITGKTQVRPVQNVTGERLVNYGRENLLGGKYLSGGKYYPQKGLDCSGFTYQIYKAFGYDIGLSTYDQMKQGTNIGKDLSKAQPGDLVILSSSASSSNQHVEMITRVEPNGRVWSMGARGVDSGIKESVFPFKASAIKTIRRIV